MYRVSLVFLIFLINGCKAQDTSNTNLDIFYLVQENVKFSDSNTSTLFIRSQTFTESSKSNI